MYIYIDVKFSNKTINSYCGSPGSQAQSMVNMEKPGKMKVEVRSATNGGRRSMNPSEIFRGEEKGTLKLFDPAMRNEKWDLWIFLTVFDLFPFFSIRFL